jgi:signal transduction histidine kinase
LADVIASRLSKLARLVDRPHLPRRTVRLRLTLVYGALFVISGAALLGTTYVLVSRATGPVLVTSRVDSAQQSQTDLPNRLLRTGSGDLPQNVPAEFRDEAQAAKAQAEAQREEQLDQLLVQSGVALGLMSVVSIGLGWMMAGRVLRPLRTMTATTRRISQHNLHERLALEGPRDELTELGDTIDGLLARLESAFDAQRRFVANASHELRTPVAMMRTSLDVASAKPGGVTPELRVLDSKLREGLDRADLLLEEFLTLARAEHGALLEQAAVSLGAVVEVSLAERADQISSKGIEVRSELDDAKVIGSEALLTRMVENVIDNAVRHNEDGGWIRTAMSVRERTARLVVESGGAALNEADVQGLAQPFRRLGGERTDSQNGVGLGLSIVSAIATAHGGELTLSARPAGGLRVEIELPSAPPASAANGGSP